MRKTIMFVLAAAAMCCALQANANVQTIPQDSVGYASYIDIEEMLRPVDPVCHKGVLVSSPWNGNWFVGIHGGASAFLGNPIGCADLFDRVMPEVSVSLGKWFTPYIGTRIGYSGWRFKDCNLAAYDYHHFHADLMYNVLGGQYSRRENPLWGLVPYVGLGMMYNPQNNQKPFALSYGVQGQYRLSKRLTASLEIGNVTTFRGFDGYGNADRFGDNMLSLSVGLSVTVGRVGWKRAVDAAPYIRQNEWLTDYISALTESNRRYAGQHDRDMRTLNELKKILQVEGLLERYDRLFDNREDFNGGYPKNDYSGLNSLRARLKNRHWDGNSVLSNADAKDSSGAAGKTDAGTGSGGTGHKDSDADKNGTETDNASAYGGNDCLAFADYESGCIGSPIYFFFELNSTRLTDASQLVNLDELARVARKYGLSISVVGAADSATGDASINDELSASRADYIVYELCNRGVDIRDVSKASRGGISDFNPTEANRHTKVMLYLK